MMPCHHHGQLKESLNIVATEYTVKILLHTPNGTHRPEENSKQSLMSLPPILEKM